MFLLNTQRTASDWKLRPAESFSRVRDRRAFWCPFQLSSVVIAPIRSLLISTQRSMHRLITAGIVSLSILLVEPVCAQSSEKTDLEVTLRLNTESESSVGWNVGLDSTKGEKAF